MELAGAKHLIFVCGHYEGVDERVRDGLVTDEISIGDYVLTNGVVAAAVIIDAAVRLMPMQSVRCMIHCRVTTARAIRDTRETVRPAQVQYLS